MKLKQLFSLLGLMIVILSVWVAGPDIMIADKYPFASVTSRGTTIFIFSLLWFFVYFTEDKKSSVRKPLTALEKECQAITHRFQQALNFLKQTYVEDSDGSKRNLEHTPWYLLIGPPQSGKSSLLANSGLQFVLSKPFESNSKDAVAQTKLCDWWITREATIIDTSGRYTALEDYANQPQKGWRTLLDLIKNRSHKRTLHGVIITIDLEEIISLDEEQRKLQGQQLRKRLLAIEQTLSSQTPIYFVINKCDVIAGFQQFFSNLDKNEREQSWGLLFPPSYEIFLKGNRFSGFRFNKEFNIFLKKLNERLLDRLHHEPNRQLHQAIKNFPAQLEQLRKPLQQLFSPLLKDKHIKKKTRGLFFTSSVQADISKNMLPDNYTESFALQMAQPDIKTINIESSQSYFINQLFRQIIFPDAQQLSHYNNPRSVRMHNLAKQLMYLVGLTLIVASSYFFVVDYQRSLNFFQQIKTAVVEYQILLPSVKAGNVAMEQTLQLLSDLSQARTNAIALSQNKLHQSNAVANQRLLDSLDESYQHALQDVFLPNVAEELLEAMTIASEKNNVNRIDSLLNTYVMLALPKTMNVSYVEQQMQQLWQQLYKNDEKRQSELNTYLNEAIQDPNLIHPIKLEKNLITQLQMALKQQKELQKKTTNLSKDPIS